MGIGFRKYITLGKLLRLNISKSGISVTAGVKGASVNIGKNGTYLNTGIPGSGIYSRKKISGSSDKSEKGIYSRESIEKAQKVLDEYDAQQKQIKLENKKSDIAPQVNKDNLDELFLEVAHYVISENCASTARIKAKFEIDYTRAGKIMDKLEENGIVSSYTATSGRKVLISMIGFNELKNKLNI